jgi:hypothetical protein
MNWLTHLTKQIFNILEHSYMFRPCIVIIGLISEQFIRYKLDNARNEIPFLQIVQWISSQLENPLITSMVNSLPYTAIWVLSPREYGRTTTDPPVCLAHYADILLSLGLCFNPIKKICFKLPGKYKTQFVNMRCYFQHCQFCIFFKCCNIRLIMTLSGRNM